MEEQQVNRRIEICGGIASGKTSLAQQLEKEGYTAIYERYEDNPFLTKFYLDKEVDNTFETEMVFVLLHSNWIKMKQNIETLVCDYSLFQDYCYGVNNLTGKDMEVFQSLYDHVLKQINPVDLTIYLKCDVECLLERIRLRDRKMEQTISRKYLQSNIETIEKNLFRQKNVIIIESDKYNFIEKDRDFIINKIKSYLNK